MTSLRWGALALGLAVLPAAPAPALTPQQMAIVANKDLKESRELAAYYAKQRGVPVEHIVELSLPTGENIDRSDYDKKLAEPLRRALAEKKDAIKCLLCVYGVPLRVGQAAPNAEAKELLKNVAEELKTAEKELAELRAAPQPDAARVTLVQNQVQALKNRQNFLNGHETQASVDSELMLLWWPEYPLHRWQVNPLNWQVAARQRDEDKAKITLMTCRLDGPNVDIARRLVDDAIAVEKVGLKGKVYFDARGIKFNPKAANETGTGYAGYDESFREAATLLKDAGLDVTLDDKQELFKPQSCPEAALYAGWYSHANFIDCCQFVPGAVAWHLASSEAVTLRNKDSKVWCPNLLKAGVAATIGPVAEPYTIGFPKPAEFFGFLATGKYTLVEVHARTQYFASWMTVCIGDPLYNPFAKVPKVKEADVFTSPKGVDIFK